MRISCGTDWLPALSLAERLHLVHQAGFEAADLVMPGPSDCDRIDKLLPQASLLPACLIVPADASGTPATGHGPIGAAAQLARRLGLSSITLPAGERRGLSVADYARTVEGVLAATSGLSIELMNRCGSRLEQVEDFRELFILLPNPRLRVVLDTLEFHRASVDPRGAVDALGDRLAGLLLGDAIGDRKVRLGEGEVNIASVLDHARRAQGQPLRLSVDPVVTLRETAAEELTAERLRLISLLDRH